MAKRKVLTPKQIALKHGFRSGLEDDIAAQLEAKDIEARYEPFWVNYIKPQRNAKYKPDFVLPNGIIIETKGRFVTEDRQKHILLKQQHPDLDIRFVFSNPKQRISKRSKTTYGMWCLKHGFKFAMQHIPDSWLEEPKEKRRIKALIAFDI